MNTTLIARFVTATLIFACVSASPTYGDSVDRYLAELSRSTERQLNLEESLAVMKGRYWREFEASEQAEPERDLWTVRVESDDRMGVTTYVQWDVLAVRDWARTVKVPATLRDIPAQYVMTIQPAYGYTEGQMYAALASGQPDAAGQIVELETDEERGLLSMTGDHIYRNAGKYGTALGGTAGVIAGYNLRETSAKSNGDEAATGGPNIAIGDGNSGVTVSVNILGSGSGSTFSNDAQGSGSGSTRN
jgi:hypothetical protein